MKKIVNLDTNQVNFGLYDEPLTFNWFDYKLKNFWDKVVGNAKRKRTFHAFHFIAFTSKQYLIGLAFVSLGIAKNIFGYVFQKDKGIIANWQKTLLNSQLVFGDDLDHHQISHHSRKLDIDIKTNLSKNQIKGRYRFKNIIDMQYSVRMGLNEKPLRVINPNDFEHWVFTEKRAGLQLTSLDVKINGEKIDLNKFNTLASIDYSGGFFKRDTNWIWGNGSTKKGKDIIGFNFAMFNNDSMFPENAVWLNNKRERYERVVFKWNHQNPYEGIEIYTLDDRLHLYFCPIGAKEDVRSHVFGLIKTNFHQYFGTYHGHIYIDGKTIKIPKFLGFSEIHKALW